jgi:hypothetical protein
VGAVVAIVGVVQRWIVQPMSRSLRDTIREELGPISGRVEDIAREVTYNGGASLKDAVRRIETRQDRLEGTVDTLLRVTENRVHDGTEVDLSNG